MAVLLFFLPTSNVKIILSYNFFIYKIKNFELICQKNIRAVNLSKKSTKVNKWAAKFVKNLKVNMNLLLKKKEQKKNYWFR